jgi:3-deoxy-D-manno-octulosonate 8-phosphate phosphatase (KDO 8-P phosphatase)
MQDIQHIFESKGGEFISSPFLLRQKLKDVKALIFDWDGVFHSGYKDESRSSSFSEADSMGVNMMRFGYYLLNKEIPFTAIISGENNPTALHWAEREHLDLTISGMKNKVEALYYLQSEHDIKPHEVLFVFDDILDLSLAKESGARFLVRKSANPLLIDYCKRKQLADYITGSESGQHCVREVSEVVLSNLQLFDETVDKRVDFDDDYSAYIKKRNAIKTKRE